MAKAVRWARRHGLDEIDSRPDLQLALSEKLRFISYGGYERLHRVNRATRLQVISESGGRCATPGCKHPGIEVDHVRGIVGEAYNNASKLQLLCKKCHLRKTWGVDSAEDWAALPKREIDLESAILMDEFVRRVEAAEPCLACDDQNGWGLYLRRQRIRRFAGSAVWDKVDEAARAEMERAYDARNEARRSLLLAAQDAKSRIESCGLNRMSITDEETGEVLHVPLDEAIVDALRDQLAQYDIASDRILVLVPATETD